MSAINLYNIIGVTQDASHREIVSAVRSMYRATHPDRLGDNSAAHIFDMVTLASNTLCDESKRAQYDKELESSTPEAERKDEPFVDSIDPMMSMTMVASACSMISYLKKLQVKYQEEYPHSSGSVSVDPITLVRGGVIRNEGFSYVIPSHSSPGDTVYARSPRGIVESATVTLSSSDGRAYYNRGSAILVIFIPGEFIADGELMNVEYSDGVNFSLSIPRGNGLVSMIDIEKGVSALCIDQRLKKSMSDMSYVATALEFVAQSR